MHGERPINVSHPRQSLNRKQVQQMPFLSFSFFCNVASRRICHDPTQNLSTFFNDVPAYDTPMFPLIFAIKHEKNKLI
jgi:hypothetical protein